MLPKSEPNAPRVLDDDVVDVESDLDDNPPKSDCRSKALALSANAIISNDNSFFIVDVLC